MVKVSIAMGVAALSIAMSAQADAQSSLPVSGHRSVGDRTIRDTPHSVVAATPVPRNHMPGTAPSDTDDGGNGVWALAGAPAAAVSGPAAWALMIAGAGTIGWSLRRRRFIAAFRV